MSLIRKIFNFYWDFLVHNLLSFSEPKIVEGPLFLKSLDLFLFCMSISQGIWNTILIVQSNFLQQILNKQSPQVPKVVTINAVFI
jgi:hypothetical protein